MMETCQAPCLLQSLQVTDHLQLHPTNQQRQKGPINVTHAEDHTFDEPCPSTTQPSREEMPPDELEINKRLEKGQKLLHMADINKLIEACPLPITLLHVQSDVQRQIDDLNGPWLYRNMKIRGYIML